MRWLALVMCLVSVPVRAELIGGSTISYQNWNGGAYTGDDGRFTHCSVSAQYVHGNTLVFAINADATVDVGVLAPTETFSEGQEFPVALFVDRRQPFFGNAFALDPRFALLRINELERALDSFRRGRTLVVQSEYGEVPFDLTGTSRALADAFNCAVRYQAYRSAPQQLSLIDPAVLMQVSTGTITTLGVTDFAFLTRNEVGELFPDMAPDMQTVFWRSESLGLLGGTLVGRRSDNSALRESDPEDIAILAKFCGGDFVTGVRQLPDADVDIREVRAACTVDDRMSEHFLTKFFVGEQIVYNWLWFETSSERTPAPRSRRELSESAAIYTASFLAK